ncbi:MAG TPA: hypothetical protein PK313_04045 [Myxococcota bacterium]|jgi:hypothetical protein|nr:hypothetical protein [Myxococcota bacterium]
MKIDRIRAMHASLAVAAALAATVVLGAPGAARAEPRARLEITVIQAKAGPPFLHPELKPLWKTLRKTFGDKFAHYQKVASREGVVESGRAVSVPLPDGTVFEATFSGLTDVKGLLRVHLAFGEFRTKVRIHDGGVFFQAGRKYEGGTLIIAVSAALADR